MIVDYHTHTSLCKHATGDLEEYVQQAVKVGLDEIGCSEHIPMPDRFDEIHRMDLDQYYSDYAPRVTSLREEFRGVIEIKRGIEADFFPGTEKWVGDFIGENDFDFVIGSVHFIGEWGFDNAVFVHRYEERDINATYRAYFKAVQQSARSGLFDIIAHCDLVKKFGHRPTEDLQDIMKETMKAIRDHDLCIEINTSGLRKPVKEVYPSETILAMAKELGIPLTLGSDAHHPEDVGKDFDAASHLVNVYGAGRIAVFTKRQRSMVSLSRHSPILKQR